LDQSDDSNHEFKIARELSPRRGTTSATDVDGLVAEQLAHFAIDPASEIGQSLGKLAQNIYQANIAVHQLWDITVHELTRLGRGDRIAYFNAKKWIIREERTWLGVSNRCVA
jgi:O-acetylhomoserine (thiol)-lyase